VTIQFAEEPLARYGVTYQRDHRHFRQVIPTQIFETRHGSPQPPLLELGPDDWLLAIEQPTHRRRRQRRRRRSSLVQAELFGPNEAVAGR
jgi:hypothetical protein